MLKFQIVLLQAKEAKARPYFYLSSLMKFLDSYHTPEEELLSTNL